MRGCDKTFDPKCGGLGNVFNEGRDYLMEKGGLQFYLRVGERTPPNPLFAHMG